METYKAIIFDIGGVCVGSPLEGISQYERKHNLPLNFINVSMYAGENGSFQRLERGEIKVHEFLKIFSEEMSNPKNKELYLEYLLLRGDKTISNETSIFPATIKIEGKELFQKMIAETTKLNPIIFKAIKNLKASNKFKIVALTNNFQISNEDSQILEFIGDVPLELKNLFDEYIESSIIGMR
ncbi:10481_t:CDS:2 [Diversispora eburnea]|uniref:10481_t:CDS:1 n=1 Tax=Diversispora eburnea TaxID=1213867 RepID=A0A9N8VQP8_9GLOM|nr:10481_t:CDS:2 [Diversispora eburnea]